MVAPEGVWDSVGPISTTSDYIADDGFEVLVGIFDCTIGLSSVGIRFVSLDPILIDHFYDFCLEMQPVI